MKFFRSGDSALFIQTGNTIDIGLSENNRFFADTISANCVRGIIEAVSSYTGIMVYFDPLITSHEEVVAHAERAFDQVREKGLPGICSGLVIPVAYGGEYGPDLRTVAENASISMSEAAALHSTGTYTIHLLGFTPGFPYMGGMDQRLSTPRKREPSVHVPAGSVGIAGEQTGIYPVDSPGGWQIIGRTPLMIYDPHRDPVFLLTAGMKVRFRAVDNFEFWSICEMINNGEYEPETFVEKR